MEEAKTAVVTGAGGGIGSAVASRLAADGFHVYALDLRFADDAWKDDPNKDRIESVPVDLGDPAAIKAAFDELRGKLTSLEALVNCVGIMRRGDALTLTEQDWFDTFRVNVDGVFFTCREALPLLEKAGSSAIANIASNWGLTPSPGHIAYSASKAAVVSLSKSLALDYGRLGIRVNAVCPGEILTPMVEQKLRDNGMTEEDLAAPIPIGRVGRPVDVAGLMSYLVGPESSYMTGGAVEITGGLWS
ncbi:SDR family NAD(P)-dependent oxidoreductase [Paenarthrobacter sp. NPDC090522]|uniref:SDR family NAD(P)-dependent oxidoreductase n=1 Tax=Paenarthrobacter sp. NPDC090522 TaxID=3364383 RepID=UPI00381BE9CC